MENSKITNLPILKHFETSEIGNQVESFRKGEKGAFSVMKLLTLAAIGTGIYFSWIYVLPPIFQAIGQVLAIASTLVVTAVLGVLAVLLAPVVVKGLRRFTRFCHKQVINHDPFAELEDQRDKMVANKTKFQGAKGKITSLKSEMELLAAEAEEKGKKLQKRITSIAKKASDFKNKMADIVKAKGKLAQTDDEYVNLHSEYRKVLSEGQRKEHELLQQKDFVTKYGSRGAIMKKFSQKLVMVETSMDIKILDFDATIDILKRDYEFAKKSREATDTAKSAMMFTEGWEFEYALDVVTSTIAQDIAITAGNLNDIDSLTANYSVDSDELFESLNLLADDINTGKEMMPDAKKYIAPDYALTHNDKINSGGFGDVF